MAEEYPDESEALIAPWFKERTKQEIFELCMGGESALRTGAHH